MVKVGLQHDRVGEDQIDGFGSEQSSGASGSSNWNQKRKDEDEGDLKYEFNRLETFLFWPEESPVSAKALAEDGFYFLGPAGEDRVRCVFCEVVLKGWEPGDVVSDDHRKFSNGCPFKCQANVGNVPFFGPSDSWNSYNYEMISWKKRLLSYEKWPKYLAQKPRVLAAAGFYYKGRGDIVQCFCCAGIVRQWLETDDPWLEHMKHFPTCYHILENIAYHKMPSSFHDMPPPGQVPRRPVQPSATPIDRPNTLQRSTSEIALAMGYREDLIRIYRQYLRAQGCPEAEDPNQFILDLERFKVQPETQSPGSCSGEYTTDGASLAQTCDRRTRLKSVSSFCLKCDSPDEPDCCYVKLDCGHSACCEGDAFDIVTCRDCNQKVKACLKIPMQED
ncbi:baculoviral IAP repeat-containing protein 7-A-like isoform X1 [Ylistrum balloti]|uniref:baculoviral IAP repeat-containing protein 7-A-like isoform X1 n=1 Tax=Ylistrum balloti TaxID=509963 RepID=UPI002905D287|nr:baculoviral IAP repeat-containing protein 7-A-like isoform X1 [Ylistrum balloti]